MVWLSIDKNSGETMTRQVYLQIRRQILDGELKQQEMLPSTRLLAAELSVSRNVVIEAFEQLLAEGYLEARQGSGTYVAQGASLEKGETIMVAARVSCSSDGTSDQAGQKNLQAKA